MTARIADEATQDASERQASLVRYDAVVIHPSQIGRYRVIEYLGQGSMGVVYRGRDETLERDVALKVMSLVKSTDEDARTRFRREAQAAAKLQHPNIVTIYELGMHQDAPYIAMELFEGMDLARAIEAGLRPDPRATLPIVLQVLSGLGHAHSHGIVHRDIKPSNIFLPKGLPAKIMDFGVARLIGSATTSSGIVGSPSYMSPEQVRGSAVDGRSDLFSVGLILYELVTGEKAFTASSVAAVLYKITKESPDFSVLPQGEEWRRLRDVLQRSLERDLASRYPDARTMTTDLTQALLDLGGSMDWASATDRGLLVSATPRPRKPLETEEIPSIPAAAPARSGAPTPRPTTRKWPLALAATAIGLIAVGGGLGLILLARGPAVVTPTIPPPSITPERRLTPEPSSPEITPTPPAGASSTPLPRPPTPLSQLSTPLPQSPAPPPTALTPSPTPPRASLDRAEAFFTRGQFQRAMDEARAVLAQEPQNESARTLLEDAEAALVVEMRLRNAREAIRKGDRETALEEVRAGLTVAPNEARLLQLFRELTSE